MSTSVPRNHCEPCSGCTLPAPKQKIPREENFQPHGFLVNFISHLFISLGIGALVSELLFPMPQICQGSLSPFWTHPHSQVRCTGHSCTCNCFPCKNLNSGHLAWVCRETAGIQRGGRPGWKPSLHSFKEQEVKGRLKGAVG